MSAPTLPRRSAGLRLQALYATQVASRTGSVAALVVVPFLVLGQGGSAIEVGVAAAAASVPIVLGGPLGGGLVDRLGAVRMSSTADFLSGGALLAVAALAALGALPFPLLLVLLFLGALLDAPGEAARRVLLPGLAGQARIPLERAVGNLEGCTRLATLIAGPLGGLLAAAIGPRGAIAATAVAFLVAGVVTAGALGGSGDGATPSAAGYWRDIAEGLRFTVRDRLLRALLALLIVTNLLDAARTSTLLPLYAERDLGGSSAFGVIIGVFGAGAFAGSIITGRIAHRLPRRVTFAIAFWSRAAPRCSRPHSARICRGCSWSTPSPVWRPAR